MATFIMRSAFPEWGDAELHLARHENHQPSNVNRIAMLQSRSLESR
jgi:hypothetical protein